MNVNESEIQVVCPGCREMITLDPEVEEGTRIGCETCAGSAFRAVHRDGRWALEPIPTASCPVCDETLELPPDVLPRDTITHCGQDFLLSFEYEAWALEKGTGS